MSPLAPFGGVPLTPRAAQGGGYGPPGGYGPSGAGGYGPPGPGGYGPPGPPRGPSKPITGSPETMALHAMTIDPKTGLPRGEKPPASTAAVVSLVCGILLCLGPFTGLPAIIAGFMARTAARERPASVGGTGMASAGIALGILNLLLSAIGALVGIYSLLQE
jgi:hypothetical protein